MTFPDFLVGLMFVVVITIGLYSWKQPLYLVPLFVFLAGGLFGQVNLDEEINLRITEGFTLVVRDFVVFLMLIHVFRARTRRKLTPAFRGPLVALLLALVANLVLKVVLFSGEFDPKISQLLRFFVSTVVVYFLITEYLTEENAMRFIHSCCLLAIVSVAVLIGYSIGLFPVPTESSSTHLFVGDESTAIRLGVPNSYFLLFPYFAVVAPLAQRSRRLDKWDIVTICSMVLGAFVALYRMYLFIVIIGLIIALVVHGKNIIKRIAAGVALLFVMIVVVQLLSEANKSGIAGAVVERFAGLDQELKSEGSSAGGRIFRSFTVLGALSDPSTALFGTVFTSRDQEMRQLIVGDLGILATWVYFGLAGLLFVIVIFKRGIALGLHSFRDAGIGGRVSGMLLLFLVSMLPSTSLCSIPLCMRQHLFCGWQCWAHLTPCTA